MADKSSKGLADIVAASTALSDIDGNAGRLWYRGYDIHDLGGNASFEETAYLLQRGHLPTRSELEAYGEELAAARDVPPTARSFVPPMAAKATPMEGLRTLASALSVDDPDRASNEADANERKAARLVAQTPMLVGAYQAARTGRDVPAANPTYGIAGNALEQITGRPPTAEQAAAFDECLVLHADHTMNASTFAARVCAATLSDMHSAVTAAIGTLKGPLHGGANEQVMNFLDSIGDVDDVEAAVQKKIDTKEKIMGFGHRVYRTEDPRATHLRRLSQRMGEIAGDTIAYEKSIAMEKVVMDAKGLYPNVDFFAASTYRALGIPTDLFTLVFAI
jgi:citrate synthase